MMPFFVWNVPFFQECSVFCGDFSFVRKKKRWFAVSSVALTGLTLYIFRDFFRMIDWWVYLLVVGLLLIAVASANEYFIKKGRELKEKAGRFFEDWKW